VLTDLPRAPEAHGFGARPRRRHRPPRWSRRAHEPVPELQRRRLRCRGLDRLR